MRARLLAVALVTLAAAPASAQLGTRASLPVPVPSRPFLLVDAPRRFTPTDDASVRVQLREGGRVRVSVFRLRDPSDLLGQAGRRQGVHTARTALGPETERLIALEDELPRRGRSLTLVRDERLTMPRPDGPRRVSLELDVYDSNEDVEDNVATYWVRTGRWSVRRVALGQLPAGLYLVQVRAGPWMSSALLSSGELVLVARRGDRGDVVRVSGPDGSPKPGVLVEAYSGRRRVGRARTDEAGLARLTSRSAQSLRYVARRGADLAWADVAHVRLRPCDPRVYVATGRPVYRDGERMYLRGHVRGCEEDGFGPLAGRVVRIEAGGDPVEARTDRDGNFVAQVVASQEITATLDGRAHRRDVQIDHRDLPRRALVVEADRPFATSGERVRVTVADPEGGWPHNADVVLDTPTGRLVESVGPGRPAVFDVRVPTTGEVVERMQLNASLTERGRITMASGELWIGRSPLALELATDRDRGARGEDFGFEVRATDLSGADADGPVGLAVYRTDGNRALGDPRVHARATLEDGRARASLPLEGEGPWWLEARRGSAAAHVVVWARHRPPSLSGRGPLAVSPRIARARPGHPIAVDVRLPSAGAGWLTLEQGGVLLSRQISGAGVHRVSIPVPEEARGLASLVLTHVRHGRVRTATSSLEVETARPVQVAVRTDRATYAGGAEARVHVEAKDDEGEPRDGVVSLWLADAGYWGLGEERYPSPNDYFALPGRPASGGDSSRPVAYGAEEGRRLDSELIFDGQRLARSSHRHGWGYGGELVRLDRRGTIGEVFAAFARAAGFSDSRVHCPEDHGAHRLRVRDLPWDLVALRLGEQVEGYATLEGDRLELHCQAVGAGAGGAGMGRGAGMARVRSGAAHVAIAREERLEGTLHFVGLRRLGPDGAIDLDVPLPDHPGRWRVEVLAIADDGGGARGHRIVHTGQPVVAWMDAPRTLRVGDRGEAMIRVRAARFASREVQLDVRLPPGLRASGAIPSEVTLDADGLGEVPIELTATQAGGAPIEVAVRADGASDRVRAALDVLPEWTSRALRFATALGPDAVEIEVPLPELAQPAVLDVEQDATLEAEVGRVLDALSRPRWDVTFLRADRLASLAALRRAMHGREGGAASLLRAEIDRAMRSELSQLASLRTSTGELGWGDHAAPRTTLEVLAAARGLDDASQWSGARAAMVRRARGGELHGVSAALAVELLGRRDPAPELTRLLGRAATEARGDLEALRRVALAARRIRHRRHEASARGRLARAVEARLAAGPPDVGCGGPAWFLCFARHSDRGQMARAALTLMELGHPRARATAARVASWIARHPPEPTGWSWGTDAADELELIARLDPGGTRRRDRYEVRIDGRRARAPHGRIRVPAGAHRVSLRFSTRAGRFRRIAISGRIRMRPPTGAQGNVALEREITRRDGRWELVARFTLPRPAEDVTLSLPVSAGMSPDLRELAHRDVEVGPGALRMRWGALRRGEHEIRIPLVALGPGRYTAGSAQLSTGDGSAWGITRERVIELGPDTR